MWWLICGSGLVMMLGSSWWPPVLCLHGGPSNFSRMRCFMAVHSTLIDWMRATCTYSWMARAITWDLVRQWSCLTLPNPSAQLRTRIQVWLITTSTPRTGLKPTKVLSHAFHTLPITSWSLRLLMFLPLAPMNCILSPPLAWMENAEQSCDTLLTCRNFPAILTWWRWPPPMEAMSDQRRASEFCGWVIKGRHGMTWREQQTQEQQVNALNPYIKVVKVAIIWYK